jgi:hypothetical protein
MWGDEREMPGVACSGWNEGVGEHVRTRSHQPRSRWRNCGPRAIRTERRKLVFFCRTGFCERSSIQPFDLMSRRHPLASIRAVRIDNEIAPCRSNDVPASSYRHLDQGETYFFFETLRVFFAVFFTALFAFFAFLAFLAMMPS